MGKTAKAITTRRCPWAMALKDGNVNRWLNAHGLLVRFPTLPQPGLNDPRVHHALTVIALEYDAIRDGKGK